MWEKATRKRIKKRTLEATRPSLWLSTPSYVAPTLLLPPFSYSQPPHASLQEPPIPSSSLLQPQSPFFFFFLYLLFLLLFQCCSSSSSSGGARRRARERESEESLGEMGECRGGGGGGDGLIKLFGKTIPVQPDAKVGFVPALLRSIRIVVCRCCCCFCFFCFSF